MDRFSRRYISIVLDTAYAIALGVMILLHTRGGLTAATIFPFAICTAALGVLHRSAIGFGALKMLSQELGVTGVVARFSASLFLTNMLGASISGLVYQLIGLSGCLTVGILTFLPMPWIYLKLFLKTAKAAKDSGSSATTSQWYQDISIGMSFIARDTLLLWSTISIAVLNIASNIFPGIVAIAFQRQFPGQTLFSSLAVSGAILAGVMAFKPWEKISARIPLNRMIAISLMAPMLALIGCAIFPHAGMFTLAFVLHCCGASLNNIMSGSLRVARVPSELTARVNTAYFAIIHLGQITGGLLLIPVLESNLRAGAVMVAIAFVLASAIAWSRLPDKAFAQTLRST
jgi:hypothetical protein